MIYSVIFNGIKKNDHLSQMAFYDLFSKPVYICCYSILNNVNEAEEIMQDTMLKVLTNKSLLKDEEKYMLNIMKRIAINASIDLLRKKKIELVYDCFDSVEIEDDNAEVYNEIEFTVEDIKESLISLPKGYKTILYLHLFENISFEDISIFLKIKQSTARSQYARALHKLKLILYKQI